MARQTREFGRRGRPLVTHRPEGLPEAKPPSGLRKRTLAISLVTAGALAAAAAHHLERRPASDCVPRDGAARSAAAPPATVSPDAPATGGGFGEAARTCPPGTVRSSGHGGSGRHLFGWSWSSSSGSSSRAPSFEHVAATTAGAHGPTVRGGFGSIGALHFSGGS